MATISDASSLRAVQKPLKDRYREDPGAARVPLRATGSFSAGDDGVVSCTVSGWAGPVRAGLHPSTGGDGGDACSGDMLLEALVACAGVTLRSVATALGVPIRRASVEATATFDARGTLGVDRDVPVGAQGYEILASLDTDADDATLTRLGELAERYCVVGQSLRESVRFRVARAVAV